MGTLTLKGAGVVPGVPWKLECPEDTTDVPEKWLESQKEVRDTIKGWYLHFGTMVIWKGQRVTGGAEETPLSVVRLCGMGV